MDVVLPTNATFRCEQCRLNFKFEANLSIHKSIYHCIQPKLMSDNCSKSSLAYSSPQYQPFVQLNRIPSDIVNLGLSASFKTSCGKHIALLGVNQVVRKSRGVGQQLRNHHYKRKNNDQYFSNKSSYDSHNIGKHNKSYKCAKCGKNLKDKCYLKDHIIAHHSGENRYLCETFGKCLKTKTDLRVHRGEKPYKCTTCGKYFSEKGSMKKHMTVHSGEKPYKCMLCGKCFSRLCHMKTHMRVHSGEKPYKCITCGKSFSTQWNMKMHLRVHSGEKPYKCMTCGKCFSRLCHMKPHMRVHSGEKPYKCITCGKSFSTQCNMKRHMRVHSGEKPY